MKEKIKRIFRTYRYLLSILFAEAPLMVIAVFAISVLHGVLSPLSVYVNSNVFDIGLEIASGSAQFPAILPYIIAFVILAVLPGLIHMYLWSYAEPRSLLVLRSSFRGRMLQKLKTMKYEHLESEASMEIIDKAYKRADNSARHMFPMYIYVTFSSLAISIGSLLYFAAVRWWLPLLVLAPFLLETILSAGQNHNIYLEMESYWKREREYSILGGFLKSRDFVRENRLNQSSDYLIGEYKSRMNSRNREYERFYFKNLRQIFLKGNITRFASIIIAVVLLALFFQGSVSVGLFISMTLLVFGNLYSSLSHTMLLYKWGDFHFNTFDFYQKYFELSDDDSAASDDNAPSSGDKGSIEFRDVWFRYPGTDRDILRGLSFAIRPGEKISVVGRNGEGKTTMIKLLLGLFTPDKGEILIGGKPLARYGYEDRVKLFGTVFQDFVRYSLPLRENVAVGDLSKLTDEEALAATMELTGVASFAAELPDGTDTLLGRDFEGGTDLSGGQWQRIAMARAFLGNRPILILDEPTSQLDPIAESKLYTEFASLAEGRTSLFITHRLGSTAITDRIIVISEGIVVQQGSHQELLKAGGLYADMFEAQKSWYVKSAGNGEGSADG